MKDGTCQFHRDRAQLAASHIIPEFLYGPMYDEKHRAIEVVLPSSRERWLQKGYREPLLCHCCEGFFNDKFEKPFLARWVRSGLLPASAPKRQHVAALRIDYRTLKLFHLSILWRCHVARGPQFTDVDLGDNAELIRQMLISGEPGCLARFPIAAILLHINDAIAIDTIVTPRKGSILGHDYYGMIYGGCYWFLFNAPFIREAHESPILLREDGYLPMGVRALQELPFVQEYLRSLS